MTGRVSRDQQHAGLASSDIDWTRGHPLEVAADVAPTIDGVPDSQDDTPKPKVTLVVAMRNERASIRRCLASIEDQDYPVDRLEVLVYDGQSTDDSLKVALEFAAGRPNWVVLTNPRRIQAAAWNAGIDAATGDILGIVSGHAELGPAYVRSAVEVLMRSGADMVGGPMRAIAEGGIASAIALATSTPFGVGTARHHYLTEPAEVDTVFMGVAWRRTWLRYSFDESFVRNQDDELSYRLLDGGGRIVCDPAIESLYRSRASLRSLWSQYFDYGSLEGAGSAGAPAPGPGPPAHTARPGGVVGRGRAPRDDFPEGSRHCTARARPLRVGNRRRVDPLPRPSHAGLGRGPGRRLSGVAFRVRFRDAPRAVAVQAGLLPSTWPPAGAACRFAARAVSLRTSGTGMPSARRRDVAWRSTGYSWAGDPSEVGDFAMRDPGGRAHAAVAGATSVPGVALASRTSRLRT